ncbi:MAG TPA: DNA primase [Candidatus Dormibacteraeota bacterium]|nr:DNA primase [Candidatus Dormibacteraeota bacterium]
MPSVKQDAVQEIKDRLDLVDLISEHLRLQKAGRDLKGLCPFHQEKTPSLYVSPEKQLWHCYGCQKGGDHFTFIQDIEHVDFRGALRLLAEKTGVVLEESPGAGRQRELKRTIARLNLLAAQYFHHILLENPAGQRALIQLESRGVTRASMTEFQLGFAPAGQHKDNLVRFLRKHGATDGEMMEAGLAIKPDGGGELWDRFRQRIIIPIHDEHGELVAFGGRVIDDTAQPKYLNTSQTALYDKGRTLFNLHRARKSIHERKHAVLMEGYFDAITAWQANVTNVVTTSGTALGEHQVRLLKRETQELLLAFDRDDAGVNATQRAIELASKSGIYIKVVRVPQGKDPDDYLRAHPDGWANLREHALPEWEYLLRQALANLDLTDARERRRGAELVIPVLAKIPEASVLEIYAQQAAGWLRIEPAALLRDVQALKSGKGGPHSGPPPRSGEGNRPSVPGGFAAEGIGASQATKDEGYLLGLLIERPDLLAEVAGELQAVSFSAPAYERVFARLQQMVEAQATVRPTDHLSEFAADEQGLISAVAMAKYPELDSGSEAALRQSLEQCLQTLKINAAQRRLKALVAEMRAARAAGDESRLVTLMQENDHLAHQLDALKDLRHGQG